MTPANFYPDFPEVPYKKTTVQMPLVVTYARSLVGEYLKEVVRTAYCVFRNEGANGNAGVNDNYIGLQGDNAVWSGLDMSHVVGTVVKKDSGNVLRRFIAFDADGYQDCFKLLCDKMQERGVYLGGTTHMFTNVTINTPEDLAKAYCSEWSRQEPTTANINNFESLYRSSLIAIP